MWPLTKTADFKVRKRNTATTRESNKRGSLKKSTETFKESIKAMGNAWIRRSKLTTLVGKGKLEIRKNKEGGNDCLGKVT